MVAIYPRQSIEKKDSLSIEQQIQRCVALCDANGWEYKIYDKDKGYSGKNMQRPSFMEMMADVRAGKVDKILCYKLDRISRNISDFSNLLVELQEHNCEFISLSENFDTTSPIGRAMIYICMVFAQMERENISQRVHDNYYFRTEKGFWGGGVAPYGYKLKRILHEGKHHTVLDIDENTAPVVQMIYEEYNKPNGSMRTVLQKLNQELRIPSRNGSEWTSRVVIDILTRPLYAPNDMAVYSYLRSAGANITESPLLYDGNLSVDLYGIKDAPFQKHKRSRKIENMYCNISYHKAIIDSETWVSVQHKRSRTARIPSRTGTGRNSIFTGIMYCGKCGKHVSYTNSRGTAGYYICSTRKNKGWNTCTGSPMPKGKYDAIITDAIITHYADPETHVRIRLAEPVRPESVSREKNALLSRIADIESKIERLVSSLAEASDVSIKYINERIAALDREKSEMNLALLNMDADAFQEQTEASVIGKISDMIDDIPGILSGDDFDSKRDIIKLLVKKITFNGEKDVDIEYTI